MIKIRGHHLLCLPRFKGASYDKKSRNKLFEVQRKIKKNPALKINIIVGCDEICKACLHYSKKKCMKRKGSHDFLKSFDLKILKLLGLKQNKTISSREAFKISIEKIRNKELKKICNGCEFLQYCLKYGVNKSFIKRLK